MLVPPWYELPPPGYGGLEQMCAALVDALADRGHEVTLIGAGARSGTKARFISTVERPQHLRLGEGLPELVHVGRANQLLAELDIDVVHDHTSAGLLTAETRAVPTVATVHCCPTGEQGDLLDTVSPSVALVAISAAQRRVRPTLPWAATVYNGLATAAVEAATPAADRSADRPVLWLARFNPDKGPDLAIQACRSARLPLVLAGKCTESSERRYLSEVIAPLVGNDAELVLNADRQRCAELIRNARCLILPIRWEEPFGMVMVEAMIQGTPVVALNRGAVPELIKPGVTGIICDDPSELPEALRQVENIDPEACVAHVQRSFSAERMARGYEEVYRTVTAESMAADAMGGDTSVLDNAAMDEESMEDARLAGY